MPTSLIPEYRRTVLRYLHQRASLAMSEAAIANGLEQAGYGGVTETQLQEVLAFLGSAGLVKIVGRKFATDQRFQITAEGMLAHERGES